MKKNIKISSNNIMSELKIKLTAHSLNRDSNLKLDTYDLIKLVNIIIQDFSLNLTDRLLGFYKCQYDNIIIILLKNKTSISIITIYPKKVNDLIMLNINFSSRKCIYQGASSEDRLDIVIERNFFKNKKKFHRNQNQKFKNGILIHDPLTPKKIKSPLKILKTMDKDCLNMITRTDSKKSISTLHFYRDKYDKKFFGKTKLSLVKYYIKPRKNNLEKYFIYLLNDKQKIIKTLHPLDFKDLFSKIIIS